MISRFIQRLLVFCFTPLMICMAAHAQPALQDGSYIIDRFELVDLGDGKKAKIDVDGLQAMMKATWVVLDTNARRIETYSAQNHDAIVGTFSPDMMSFTNKGETRPVRFKAIDDNHFSTEVGDFVPVRLYFRKVASDGPELAAIKAARQAEFERRDADQAAQQATLETIKNEVEQAAREAVKNGQGVLDVRLPLFKGASLAISKHDDVEQYEDGVRLTSEMQNGVSRAVLDIYVYGPDESARQDDEFKKLKQEQSAWNDPPVMIEDNAIYWVDSSGAFRLDAQEVMAGTTYRFVGAAESEDGYRHILSLWKSLSTPVAQPEFLR